MSNRPQSASLYLIKTLSTSSTIKPPQKVRLAGRIIAVEPRSSIAILEHQGYGIMLDLSLCLGGEPDDVAEAPVELPKVKDRLMVIGNLEWNQDPSYPAPPLTHPNPSIPSPAMDTRLIVRTIFVKEVEELDLNLWSKSLETMEEVRDVV